MRDYVVRKAFHESVLRSAHASIDTIVLDEFGLKNGEYRADIAVLNGKMIGYEIKTDSDTLDRLFGQIIAYNEVFDNVFIVTGPKHLDKVLKTVPYWWGVYLINQDRCNGYIFNTLRRAKKNNKKESAGIAQLLWKDEVIDILTTNYAVKTRTKSTREELYDNLTERCNATTLGKIALKYLKGRKDWRINQKRLL